MKMLYINNAQKSFRDKRVIDGLFLEIEDHTIFGLVGVNGSGKSTLLRSIAGIYRLDKGTVRLDEHDTYYDQNIRRHIVYVSDDLYYGKTTTINTLKALYESLYDFDQNEFKHYLRIFKFDPKRNINRFSKGMKRQVYLMLALCIHPRVLLLDEAFDGLDPLVRLEIKKGLIKMMDEYNTTIIISSHNLKELEDICDTFGILSDGKIKTSGDLLASKQNINKYQISFAKKRDLAEFNDLDIIKSKQSGRVLELVIRGNREEIVAKLNLYDPLLIDILDIDFEELFIYEVENRGSNNE